MSIMLYIDSHLVYMRSMRCTLEAKTSNHQTSKTILAISHAQCLFVCICQIMALETIMLHDIFLKIQTQIFSTKYKICSIY